MMARSASGAEQVFATAAGSDRTVVQEEVQIDLLMEQAAAQVELLVEQSFGAADLMGMHDPSVETVEQARLAQVVFEQVLVCRGAFPLLAQVR
jgi:hypothetical protein